MCERGPSHDAKLADMCFRCARLGLQCLAYLWQYNQSQLLDDMAQAGMDSIIIKVAGAGLGVRHLGQNVCSESMRVELENLVRATPTRIAFT